MITFFIMTGLFLTPHAWEKRLKVDNKFDRKEAKTIADLRANLDESISRLSSSFKDSVSDTEVNDFFRLLRKEFPSEKAFEEILSELGLSEHDLKEEIKSELAVFHWIDDVFEKTLPGDTTTVVVPEERIYREIYIPAPPYLNWYDRLLARLHAWRVWALLKFGKQTFEDAVKRYSHGRTRGMGGIREPVFYIEDNPLSKIVFKLRPDEISKPIETRWGFYIIKLEEIKPQHREKFGNLSFKQKRFTLYRMLKGNLERLTNVRIK